MMSAIDTTGFESNKEISESAVSGPAINYFRRYFYHLDESRIPVDEGRFIYEILSAMQSP